MEEDIILMMENLSNPKEWAKISKRFPGRTQHQIKNRFICLLCKETGLKREKIWEILNENTFFGLVYRILQDLKARKTEENNFFEGSFVKNVQKTREDVNFMRIDDFISFQNENPALWEEFD